MKIGRFQICDLWIETWDNIKLLRKKEKKSMYFFDRNPILIQSCLTNLKICPFLPRSFGIKMITNTGIKIIPKVVAYKSVQLNLFSWLEIDLLMS